MSRTSAVRVNVSWPKILIASNIIIPTAIVFLNPTWCLPPFVPRQLIHDNHLLPLLFAPWSGPRTFPSTLSRGLQVFVTFLFPIATTTYQYIYWTWIYIALARALAGWIFSRAVGWALPRLFRHWSLYEPTSGFGPILFVIAILQATGTLANTSNVSQRQSGALRKYGHLPYALAFGTLLCWMENSPWTYGITLLAGMALVLIHRMLALLLPSVFGSQAGYNSRSRADTEMGILGEHAAETEVSLTTNRLGIRKALFLGILSLILMEAPYNVIPRLAPPSLTPMPIAPSSTPLLEILILTYPRSNAQASAVIMQATIESYRPLLNGDVRLSVFTHAREHQAFEYMKKLISDTAGSNITFYADQDTHSDAVDGHYLHLAEAFRWVSEPRLNQAEAEWVMLVEDDFPICAGEVGEDALRQVLTILEASRPEPNAVPRRRGGFIGTGGSGLIIHRTLLPILQLVLRAHADKQSKLPIESDRRPPDVVLQDCLLGKDPFCPLPKGDVCFDQNSRPASCGLVITSRLVMDHIGGMFSTTDGKAPNNDKWRCGWRHPFHGTEGVEVVVVDW